MISKIPPGRFCPSADGLVEVQRKGRGTYHTEQGILYLGVTVYQTQFVQIMSDHRRIRSVHIPSMYERDSSRGGGNRRRAKDG
jgi:hypothetical protein